MSAFRYEAIEDAERGVLTLAELAEVAREARP
jgi:hypothetical protein